MTTGPAPAWDLLLAVGDRHVLVDMPRLRRRRGRLPHPRPADALATWDTESTTRYVWREAFDHHQVGNRPPDVVTHTVVGGRLVRADGAATAALGVERASSVLTAR